MRIAEPHEFGAYRWRYLIALGSNIRHHRHGDPRRVLQAALTQMDDADILVETASPIVSSAPVGPSKRRYANTAALIVSNLAPPALLARLKQIERAFGRRPGRRWAARVLDLDIVLWDGGDWRSRRLTVPHPAFRGRGFVLEPVARLAPHWRDPVSHLTLRQLHARLTRHARLPRARAR